MGPQGDDFTMLTPVSVSKECRSVIRMRLEKRSTISR